MYGRTLLHQVISFLRPRLPLSTRIRTSVLSFDTSESSRVLFVSYSSPFRVDLSSDPQVWTFGIYTRISLNSNMTSDTLVDFISTPFFRPVSCLPFSFNSSDLRLPVRWLITSLLLTTFVLVHVSSWYLIVDYSVSVIPPHSLVSTVHLPHHRPLPPWHVVLSFDPLCPLLFLCEPKA